MRTSPGHAKLCDSMPVRRALVASHLTHTCRQSTLRYNRLACRASASTATDKSFSRLENAALALRNAPPSEKYDFSKDVLDAMTAMKENGALRLWGSACDPPVDRRNVFLGELKRGFFVPYLTGGISIAVLAVGSTAPGLLEFAIGKFSSIFPDYRERVLRHEAAHFLVGYLMGVPVGSYSLDLGRAHTDFIETKLQRRLIEGTLEDSEVTQLACVAMAGAAAEAMQYSEVTGQNADMLDLQRLMMRGKAKLNASQQQNLTRLAVYEAARLLRDNDAAYKALQAAMQSGSSVPDCIRAIESA